jgi:putative hydrolase of the HAD superfamily
MNMNGMAMFDLIAFDADDTLWHNERLYQMGRDRFRKLLAKYQVQGAIDERVNEVEVGNLRYYGYGVMSFVLSLIELAIETTGGRISGDDIGELIDLGKEMLSAEVELFDHAQETLEELSGTYPLMLITKGESFHQQKKIKGSGLKDYFRHVEVVPEKTVETYQQILTRQGINASRFLMVGNSLRSDILPVVQLGGWGVFIHNALTWSHEQVDPPIDTPKAYFEVEHLGQLPGLIRDLTGNSQL